MLSTITNSKTVFTPFFQKQKKFRVLGKWPGKSEYQGRKDYALPENRVNQETEM